MFNTRRIIQRFISLNKCRKSAYTNLCKVTALQQNHLRQYTKKSDDCNVIDETNDILDVVEQRRRYQAEAALGLPTEQETKLYGLNLERGAQHVFDIEDLVEVLHKENAEDVFVCAVPKALKYVDFLVICSGRSYRHSLAIAEFVRRLFKIKRHSSDFLPHIEGKSSRDWMAVDLGNIALHIMSAEVREKYDLESLWAIGAEYDHEFNKPKDPLVELFDRHIMPVPSTINNEQTAHTNIVVEQSQNKLF